MRRFPIRIILLAAVAMAVASCDDSNSGSGGPPPPGAKPGRVIGKLSDEQGKPLTNVTVRIFGFSDKGEPVDKEVTIKGPAGEYEIVLPDGKYNTPVARIGVDYNGRWYDLPLAGADGTREWMEQKESKQGMVRDFVWKISGRVPGTEATSPAGYWGGSVLFDKAEDLGDGALVEIILTPDGPLIDGSPGKSINFKRKMPWRKPEDHYLFDIPLGKYMATAKVDFGSNPKPLRLAAYTIDPNNPDVPNPDRLPTKIAIEFECVEVKKGEWKLLLPNLMVFRPG